MPKPTRAPLTPKPTRLARLKQFQAERGLHGPAELGRAIGRRTNQTSDLLNGRAPFGERIARAIELFAGLPVGWLDQEPEPAAARAGRPARAEPAANTAPPLVAVHPLAGAAGAPGGVDAEDRVQQPVHAPLLLARDWLRAVAAGGAGAELRYLHMPDDSLAPVLARGDLLLIDAGVRAFGRDGVYVLRGRGRLLVRQLRARLDGAVEVSAGSALGASSELVAAGALSVVGQAVWVWRGQPL